MVVYKNSPGQNETYLYQKRHYRLSNSPADIRDLDRIAESYLPNESYQKRITPRQPSNDYDLSQPVWFEEIRKRLANSETGKGKNKTPVPGLSCDYLRN